MKKTTLALLLLLSIGANANNLQITNVATNVSGGITTVSFDVSWENSWRGGPAANYDAAWIFIKYKDDNGEWHHLNLTGANNAAASPLSIEAPADKKGIFVFRTADGFGNIAPTIVTVGVQQKSGNHDIKVFGLEMVYVPQGSFYVGDNTANSSFRFYDGASSSHIPYLINSSTPPPIGITPGTLNFNGGGNAGGPISPGYPTGYNAFYMMKYELSEGGYRDFLNATLKSDLIYLKRTDLNNGNYTVAGTPVFSGVALADRHFLKTMGSGFSNWIGANASGNGVYDEANDGEWVACSSLLWSDVAAYLDWAALRPMTDFEYEKACRGPEVPTNGLTYTTGSFDAIPTVVTVNGFGTNSESITLSSTNSAVNLFEMNMNSPLRCGFAATATTNRISAGSSYYGIMELTGNVWEYTVTSINTAGKSFTGVLGDGELEASGAANQNAWPGLQGAENTPNTNGVIDKFIHSGVAPRGGSYLTNINFSPVSEVFLPTLIPNNRAQAQGFGGRGVR